MTSFAKATVAEALESAIAAATHLTSRDSAAIAAARALAKKIDVWDVIVEWAIEDAAETESRPKVPVNDNTSLPTFLKYLEALQLMPSKAVLKPGPASTASDSQQGINAVRAGLQLVPATIETG